MDVLYSTGVPSVITGTRWRALGRESERQDCETDQRGSTTNLVGFGLA